MRVRDLLLEKREDIFRIARSHGAIEIRVFGSAARETTQLPQDIDLLVKMEEGRSLLDIIAIKQDLEELLNYRVDVVTEASLSPYIRDTVLSEAHEL